MLLQTISSDSSINKVSSKGNIKIKSLQYNNIKQKLNSTQLVRSESISIMIYPNQQKNFSAYYICVVVLTGLFQELSRLHYL